MNGVGFDGDPVRVVLIKDDCCEQAEEHCEFVESAFNSIYNIDLNVVGCSKLLRSIKAIPPDSELIFTPYLRGCKRDAVQIIKQLRKERNGVPIVAYGEETSVDTQVSLLSAGADYVTKRTQVFSKESLYYLVHNRARAKK